MSGFVITLDKDTIASVDVSSLLPYLVSAPEAFKSYLVADPGKEHYRLLAYLSEQLGKSMTHPKVSDVGTYHGASALSLSMHPDVQVTTYDILKLIPHTLSPLHRPNVFMKVMSGQLDIAEISKSDIVVLDIDPHDGPSETEFVQLLVRYGFRGLLICDDIHLNSGMQHFWSETIPSHLKKVDVSPLGHWTGTGIVVFDPSIIDVNYNAK